MIAPEAQTTPRGSIEQIILVVEDDDDVRAQAVAMLRELGYGVLEAVDGASALAILDSQPVVHLLFTDVGLPNGMFHSSSHLHLLQETLESAGAPIDA